VLLGGEAIEEAGDLRGDVALAAGASDDDPIARLQHVGGDDRHLQHLIFEAIHRLIGVASNAEDLHSGARNRFGTLRDLLR